MEFLLAAYGLLLHLLLWGAGAAILLAPARWRRFWPAFAAPMGIALQSAVVWAGAYAGLTGTDTYARWSLLLPLALLVVAVRRRGGRVRREAAAWWGVALAMALALGALVGPMAQASRELTTVSLGSCDAADYAAGARVLQEFARSDRSGFLGLTEVVRVASVDNFYDFWLRLNHFTPSALIAFNDSVFGLRPHELTGLLAAVLLVATLPGVYWLARTVVRLRPAAAIWVAAVYGFSPVTWYAVAHVAIGQQLAALAIVYLTWAGVALARNRPTWALAGVLVMAYWIILGGYNFIVLVCLVPALTFAGGRTLRTGAWGRLARWCAVLLVPLALCGAVFTQRTLGLLERFQLFGQFDFGWRIPVVTPEGWLGAVGGTSLAPLPLAWRILAALVLAGVLGVALARDWRRRGGLTFAVIALVVPVMAGYAFLEVRGVVRGTNASYDAYKILAVFFPGLLVAAAAWTRLAGSAARPLRLLAWLCVAGFTVATAAAARDFMRHFRNPPLIVTPAMAQLQLIESRPEVTSINLEIGDFWTRLWANAFLLRRPQYFPTHTYEGRLNTPLRGEWELNDQLASLTSPSATDTQRIGRAYNLLRRASPYYLRVELTDGWYPLESLPRAGRQWRWSKGDAVVRVLNPHATSRTVTVRLRARSLVDRGLELWNGSVRLGSVAVHRDLGEATVPGLTLEPGWTTLLLRSPQPPTPGTAADGRTLGFALYGLELAEAAADPDDAR
ncbi:MAG: hypothetical protein JSR48_05320 [Verrucomicrobia bacterium]|nr:hypothetical protein [Verrucomicrobiota bacterium]